MASAASKLALTALLMLMTSVDPQQLVTCCTNTQSFAVVQVRSNSGKLGGLPVHCISFAPPPMPVLPPVAAPPLP
jgi:hypothetical protein